MEILKNQEKGTIASETAWINGLGLVASGDMVDIERMRDDLDPATVKFTKELLMKNKESIKAITKDAKGIRETLCNAQEALSRENYGFLVGLDLWDRLEKAYRAVFPDDLSCIHGEKGCPDHYDLSDTEKSHVVVRCKACVKGVKNGI